MPEQPSASPLTEAWRNLAPPEVPAVAAMTSEAERRYYYWLARQRFTGAGAVVEIGCWLGGGTVYLAADLRDRGAGGKVVCIDRFLWGGETYERSFAAGLAKGDDFEPLFRAAVAPLAAHIEVIRAELQSFVWQGPPIELLLVDAPKQVDLVIALLTGFGAALIPGKSVLAFQDYLHGPAYALPAILAEFEELRPLDVVTRGSMLSFELVQPLALDAARLERCRRLLSWGAAETRAKWRRLMQSLPAQAGDGLALGLPMLLHDQGHLAEAVAAVREVAPVQQAQRQLH